MGLLTHLSAGQRWAVRYCLLAVLVGIALMALHAFADLGSDTPRLFNDWIFTATILAATVACWMRVAFVPAERGAWSALAIGLSLYSVGTVLWSFWIDELMSPPFPSLADPFWLALYPASYLTIGLIIKRRVNRFQPSVWLDGVIAGLAVAALGVAFVYDAVVSGAVGTPAAIATNLAYPLFDMLLAAIVMVVFALAGWRPGVGLVYLGSGFILLACADSVFVNQVAAGTYVPGGLANFLWVAGIGLIAVAAWQPAPAAERTADRHAWSSLAVPALFTLTAVGLLIYDHFARLNLLTLVLAALTLGVAAVRTALAYREVRSFAETRAQAMTDELTGLPNRRHFYRRLDQVLTGRRPEVGVLIIDLDHFKELNDTLGHYSGDLLLQEIGPRLRGVVREEDLLARLGGDEFAVLMHDCDRRAAARVAERIRHAIARPFVFQDLHLIVDASIGIALAPEHGQRAEDLVRHADVAMYQAKGDQTGHEFYVPDRDDHSRSRLALLGDLRSALGGEEIIVHFQPKCELPGRRVRDVEALVRWEHPERGLISPDEIVPLAEQSGLMRQLTLRVLDQALAQCADWRRRGYQLGVAVNLGTPNLLDAQLPGDVADLLQRTEVPPEMLVLEITESTIMADPVRTMDVLARLGELGVGLSLDDFGTGLSSLAYLRRLPVEELKIDRSFVMNLAGDEENAAIVESVIRLGHSLGLRVVAEGVEDEASLLHLEEIGCDLVQGYHLGRPMPAAKLAVWLEGRELSRSGRYVEVPEAVRRGAPTGQPSAPRS